MMVTQALERPIGFDSETILDRGIAEAVHILRDGGVETFESCEGGPGHTYSEPTIRFHGDAWAGYRAFSVAMERGLSVAELRRVYDVVDTQLHGPWWEMTLRTTGKEPLQVAAGFAEGVTARA